MGSEEEIICYWLLVDLKQSLFCWRGLWHLFWRIWRSNNVSSERKKSTIFICCVKKICIAHCTIDLFCEDLLIGGFAGKSIEYNCHWLVFYCLMLHIKGENGVKVEVFGWELIIFICVFEMINEGIWRNKDEGLIWHLDCFPF